MGLDDLIKNARSRIKEDSAEMEKSVKEEIGEREKYNQELRERSIPENERYQEIKGRVVIVNPESESSDRIIIYLENVSWREANDAPNPNLRELVYKGNSPVRGGDSIYALLNVSKGVREKRIPSPNESWREIANTDFFYEENPFGVLELHYIRRELHQREKALEISLLNDSGEIVRKDNYKKEGITSPILDR